jgi:hypothetical protein
MNNCLSIPASTPTPTQLAILPTTRPPKELTQLESIKETIKKKLNYGLDPTKPHETDAALCSSLDARMSQWTHHNPLKVIHTEIDKMTKTTKQVALKVKWVDGILGRRMDLY